MNLPEQQIADDLTARSIDLLRLSAGEIAVVLDLLQVMQKELTAKLAAETLTEFGKAATKALLKETKEVIIRYYSQAQLSFEATLTGLGAAEAQFAARTLTATFGVQLGAGLPTETYLATLVKNTLIQGAPSAAWWERQAGDTAFRFANEVRQGLAQGETNAQIISRVREEVLQTSRRNAAALVQTSVQTVANEARMATFEENGDVVKGYVWLSTLDGRTSTICIARSGLRWNKDGTPVGHSVPFRRPPAHWNCRSVLTPWTKTFRELGIDIDEPEPTTRASMDGPVSASTTFEQFLDRKGAAFQDDLLGPGRAQLYRSGKITLQDLLDQNGRPLTLEQLNAKYR